MRAFRRICASSIALFTGIAHAQTTITKAANETDLSLVGSWVGGVVPGSADIALWDSTVTGANSVLLGADLSWLGLRLTSPGGPVTINAGNTLTLGNAGIDLSLATRDLTLKNAVTLGTSQNWNVGAGRTLTATGSVGDAGGFLGLTKTGAGTLVLAGANTYSGPTVVNRGTLLLNFAAASAPDANILNANSALQLGGGTLTIQGAENETNTQTFVSTAFNAGLNTVNITASPNGQATLALGSVTTSIDAVVRFNGTGMITAGTATVGTNGILGANGSAAINVASAGYGTVGLDDFAALGNGSIVAGSTVAAFYQNTYGGNFDMTADTALAAGGAQRAATVVRYNTPTATTLTGGTSNLITFGAALITPNMGANNASMTGAGSWQIIRQTSPNGPQQGTIWQNNPLGFYSVTIPIIDGREGVSDPSRIVKAGVGTVVFSGANTYTGRTSIYEGALMVTADTNLGGASAPVVLRGGTLFGNATFSTSATRAFTVEDTGGLAASTGNTLTVNGAISGTGTLIIGSGTLTGTGAGTANPTPILGSGKVALAGDNTYSGGTTVDLGTAIISGINALGGANYGGLTLINGGTLQYASTLSSASDLTIGNGITLGTGGGGIDTNGNNVSFSNDLNGSGGLVKSGAGALTLTAPSTYSGGTIINGGTLTVAAPVDSATGSGSIIVNSGGTLSGTGTVGGAVTVNAGGMLDPGVGVGTLILPGLTLGANSLLKFEFNSTPANDFIQVTDLNGLTIGGGNVNVFVEGSGSPFATAGTYNLFSFAGAIQGAGIDAFSVINPAVGFSYTFNTVSNFITLTVATSGFVTNWAAPTGGSWNTASNWSNGVPNGIGAIAIFGNALSAPGAITLDGNKTIGSASFDSAQGYTIAVGTGGSLTFQTSSGSANLVAPRGSHTLSAPVLLGSNLIADVGTDGQMIVDGAMSGARSLTKRGDGVLSLMGANSYSGDTTLEAGVLGVGHATALGTGALGIPASATLRADANALTVGNNIVIGSGATATVDTQDHSVILSGIISGANGVLRKRGTGTLSLTGANTYTGGTVLDAGTLLVNSIGALSTGAVSFAGNATLQQASALTLENGVSLGAGVTAVIDTNGNDMVLNGNVVGDSGGLAKIGSGVLTLNGTNNFATAGGAQLSASEGTVAFGAAAAAPSGLGLLTAGGTFDLNGFSITASALSGTSGVITDNSILGGITILTLNQTANTSFAGSINNGASQVVALTKANNGTLILSGNNTYTGATNALGGILQLDAGGVIATSALTIATNGTMRVSGGALTVNGATALDNAGGAAMSVTNGSATLNGPLTTGNSANRYFINVQGGTFTTQTLTLGRTGLNFSAEPAAGSATDGLYIQGGTVEIGGAMGMGIVSATNSSVSTRVDGGSLTVGGPITIGLNNAGRWSVLDVNGGTFTSNDPATGIIVGGPFAGNALLLVRTGTATVERIELSSLAGATSVLNVTGGSLYIGSGGIVPGAATSGTNTVRLGNALIGAKDTWSSSLPMSLTGETTFHAADAASAPHDITLSGALTDFGSLLKTGGGTLTLSGANSYTGSTRITGGSIILSGSLSGTTTLTVAGASLELAGSNGINDAAPITLGTGGTLNTAGFSDVIGALTMDGDAAIALGDGASVLRLADSAFSSWSGATLTIAGWSGSVDGQGQDQIYFGTNANGLTASQLAQVRFLDPLGFAPGLYDARLLTTGELVAIPEPGSAALLLAGMGSLIVRLRRRS